MTVDYKDIVKAWDSQKPSGRSNGKSFWFAVKVAVEKQIPKKPIDNGLYSGIFATHKYYTSSSGSMSGGSSGMSGGQSSGGSSSGGSSGGGSMGYSESGRGSQGGRGQSSRSENAKRGYEEAKMMQDGSPESKKKAMESLENYMKELGEEMSELIGKMDSSEKSMLKNKLQTLAQRVS